jgi:hypothetical protein
MKSDFLIFQKPIGWVAGVGLSLLLQPESEIAEAVLERFQLVFPREHYVDLSNVITSAADQLPYRQNLTVAVYVSGNASSASVMKQIDSIVAKVEAERKVRVGQVFIKFDSVQESAAYMRNEYPRHFKFAKLPVYSSGRLPEEIVEFLADIHILTSADILLGSKSTMYTLVSLLRTVYFPERVLENTFVLETL